LSGRLAPARNPKKFDWIANAFLALDDQVFPGVKAISWWHENFDSSVLKINSTESSLRACQRGVASHYTDPADVYPVLAGMSQKADSDAGVCGY
jgi:hypothetical protein